MREADSPAAYHRLIMRQLVFVAPHLSVLDLPAILPRGGGISWADKVGFDVLLAASAGAVRLTEAAGAPLDERHPDRALVEYRRRMRGLLRALQSLAPQEAFADRSGVPAARTGSEPGDGEQPWSGDPAGSGG